MRLTKYNPAFLDADEREHRFGARHRDLAELLRIVRENRARAHHQHVVVVGARGMGKTMLLLRTADVVSRDEELSKTWFPVVLSEETYRVASIGELWLEVLFHLARSTGEQRHRDAHERLGREFERATSPADDTRLATAALGHLVDFADQEDKRLLLVVENLQMLFGEQLSEHDGWASRETLIGEPRLMLLASAVSEFQGLRDPKAPLFEQFLIHRLESLDLDDCLALWERATGLAVPARRMRALQILTGGNPRLLTILAEFAGRFSLRELMQDLAALLDEHTDYLKMTTEALPPLERKVFVTLAEIWDYASAADVAAQARVATNVASAQLGRLVDRGAVVSRPRGRGKEYRIAERLYGLYHLMRRRGGVAARARAATEFMAIYYDGPELARRVGRAAESEGHLREAVELAPHEPSSRAALGRHLADSHRSDEALEQLRALAEIEERSESTTRALTELSISLAAAGKAGAALGVLEQSPQRDRIEPLLVALQKLEGRAVRAPAEIEEVAADLVSEVTTYHSRGSGPSGDSAS